MGDNRGTRDRLFPFRTVPKFPEGWQLGKPDLIVKMDRPLVVPAEGEDIYQNFVIPLHLLEDNWVTRIREAAVVLPDGTVAYCGRVNDLYAGLGKKRPAPQTQDLRDALTAVLDGKPVATPRTDAVGCVIPDLPK